ncbi:MAG TPA: glycosyltransferase family 87 protein [Acidisarcina sp.]
MLATSLTSHCPDLLSGFRLNRTLLVVLIYLSVFYGYLSMESYQMDFRAFYVAAEAERAGLDPYKNNVTNGARFADSDDPAVISRYLYPPTALFYFRPLALLPYNVAKLLYSAVILAITVSILLFLQHLYGVPDLWVVALFLSFPVLGSFDRGQIDLVVLACLLLAFFLSDGWLAGIFLGSAIAIKLLPVLAVGWFFAHRRYRTSAWAVAVAALLAALAARLWGLAIYREFLVNLFHPSTTLLAGVPRQSFFYRVLVAPEGTYYIGHSYAAGTLNPLIYAGRLALPVGVLLFAAYCLWALRMRFTPHLSYFGYIFMAQLLNRLLWVMGLVLYFPACMALIGSAKHKDRTGMILLAPLFLPRGLVPLRFVGCVLAFGWVAWQQHQQQLKPALATTA